MKHKNMELCKYFNIDNQVVVSRSHLPVLLGKVNLSSFEDLLFSHYGLELNQEEKAWFAADGKELRGSIEKGDKRGEAIVQLVSHETREVAGQSFYNGLKESEKPCLKKLLEDTSIQSQKITADALHLYPTIVEDIAEAKGTFIIGLKGNQAELLEDMQSATGYLPSLGQLKTCEKAHGRIEQRHYVHYDISGCYFDKRWENAEFKSLFTVERKRTELKSGRITNEKSYYISNAEPVADKQYFKAIRGHWSVETNNHIRDVTLNEDQMRTKKRN
jgi:predicted transposase YbfD/YdcC